MTCFVIACHWHYSKGSISTEEIYNIVALVTEIIQESDVG